MCHIVEFHDPLGHHEVRKVCRSLAGARTYIEETLKKLGATEIKWEACGTYVSAMAPYRGDKRYLDLLSYSISAHEIAD